MRIIIAWGEEEKLLNRLLPRPNFTIRPYRIKYLKSLIKNLDINY